MPLTNESPAATKPIGRWKPAVRGSRRKSADCWSLDGVIRSRQTVDLESSSVSRAVLGGRHLHIDLLLSYHSYLPQKDCDITVQHPLRRLVAETEPMT
jgi:hypothetical protein